jgi:hypothetical protein
MSVSEVHHECTGVRNHMSLLSNFYHLPAASRSGIVKAKSTGTNLCISNNELKGYPILYMFKHSSATFFPHYTGLIRCLERT